MLLRQENTRRPIRRTPVRESMEDRLYLPLKRKSPIKESEDEDVIIDFDDDIGDIEVDDTGYDFRKDIPSCSSSVKRSSDDIQSILFEINSRLINIENMLKKGSNTSGQRVTVTTQQAAEPINTVTTQQVIEPVNEALVNGDVMGRLRPPVNVVPEGSMLGEIQTVLTQQASMAGADPTQAGNDISGICTLPNSEYDDEIPDIEV